MATSIYINISDFWEMTPKELNLSLLGFIKSKEREAQEYAIKLKQEQDLLTIQAYQISRWVWSKKVDINKFLNTKKQNKTMTDVEMLKQVKKLNALFGGEVVTNGKK